MTWEIVNPFPSTPEEVKAVLAGVPNLYVLLDRADEMQPLMPWVEGHLLPSLPTDAKLFQFRSIVSLDWHLSVGNTFWQQMPVKDFVAALPTNATVLYVSLGGAFRSFPTAEQLPRFEAFIKTLAAKKVRQVWWFPCDEECIPKDSSMDWFGFVMDAVDLSPGSLETLKALLALAP